MAVGLFEYDATPCGDLPFFANPRCGPNPHLVVPSAPAALHSVCAEHGGLQAVKFYIGGGPVLHAPVFNCTPQAK
eukprot:3179240-Rhodomonas_salina.1